MTAGHSETSRQRDTNDDPHVPEHSQTLPMITEEVAVAPAKTAETPTQHVSTQVIPPNPVRRETPAAPNTAAPNDVTAPAIVAAPAGESAGEAEEEKKSEGRISATQLIAGAGAAATSSVVGGQLGVAGTVVGAGVASIITALAVTLYGRSLDKGKEKIQEVSSKLAPAVKAKIAKNPADANGAVDPSLAEDSAFAPPEPAGIDANPAAASAKEAESVGYEENTGTDEKPRGWWQQLRRKRVLYPLTIGVAAFGIGLGGVVMAESFTDADISPGTSQISRSVSGQSSTGEDPGTGTSDSGTSGEGSAGGSGSGQDGSQGSTDSGSGGQNAQSTSAGESGSQGTDTGQADQGTDSTTSTGTDTGSTTAEGTDTSSGATGSDGTESTGGGGDSSGGADGSSSTGGGSGSGSSGAGGGSGGAGTGGSAGGSSGGSGTSAQG